MACTCHNILGTIHTLLMAFGTGHVLFYSSAVSGFQTHLPSHSCSVNAYMIVADTCHISGYIHMLLMAIDVSHDPLYSSSMPKFENPSPIGSLVLVGTDMFSLYSQRV